MKKLFALLFFVLGSLAFCDESWSTDFAAVQKKAKETGKPILIVFAGSDWCPPCQQLEKNVLSKKEFQKAAEKAVVFFFADFPRKKSQSDKVKKQNQGLAQKYQVKAFPTVIIIGNDGKELAHSVGAPARTVPAFLAWLNKNVAK